MEKEELDKRVEREIEELTLAGRLYRFEPDEECAVCKEPEVSRVVNKLLAAGETYANILQDIQPFNDQRVGQDKISLSSIRQHAKEHFNTDDAARAVYRRILERNAAESNVDFVSGTKNAVTPMAYLETVMSRGYETLVDSNTKVTVDQGMAASLQLHGMTRENATEEVDKLIDKTNRLIQVVRDVVPVSYWEEIVRRLDEESRYIEGRVEEIE